MKISIITVTLNSGRTVEDTFKSVLSQEYEDYEYVVVDGGSKDLTVDIIKKFEPLFEGRMRWVSEPDEGIYDAMNRGFRMAQGEILMLINSDDILIRPDVFRMVVDKFEQNPDADCVYGDLYYVSKGDTAKIVRRWKTGVQKPFRWGWLPAHPTFYVKREVYEQYGYFDISYSLAADFELMLRFVEGHGIKLVYLPEYLVSMRLGGATSKNLKNIYRQNVECIRAFKENGLKCSLFYPIFRYLPKVRQFLGHD